MVILKIDTEITGPDGLHPVTSIIYDYSAMTRAQRAEFQLNVPYLPEPDRAEGYSYRLFGALDGNLYWYGQPEDGEPGPLERVLWVNQALALDAARARRWQAEISGTVAGGIKLRTDERSQGRVAGLATTVMADPDADSVDFEAQPGVWVAVDRDTAIAIGKAVSAHVQACFTNCKSLHEQIQAAQTLDELNGVDIDAGWPGSDAR